MRVDGAVIGMLFDTGAAVQLSAAALNALHDGRPRYRATSFIIASIFERWRMRHPGWRVIDNADEPLREPMIEVSSIEPRSTRFQQSRQRAYVTAAIVQPGRLATAGTVECGEYF